MKRNKLALLGPEGSYSFLAAQKFYPDAEVQFVDSIVEVFESVRSDTFKEGLVPIENSVAGPVLNSREQLASGDFRLLEEHEMPIEHCLATLPGVGESDITKIYSHPQALKQCDRYLKKHFEKAELVEAESTTTAVNKLSKKSAVICSLQAAELNDLAIFKQGIADNSKNVTRFALITKK